MHAMHACVCRDMGCAAAWYWGVPNAHATAACARKRGIPYALFQRSSCVSRLRMPPRQSWTGRAGQGERVPMLQRAIQRDTGCMRGLACPGQHVRPCPSRLHVHRQTYGHIITFVRKSHRLRLCSIPHCFFSHLLVLPTNTTTQCPPAGLDFVFHMFFLLKYCKSLEEGSFRGRSADFMWMLLLGGWQGGERKAAGSYRQAGWVGRWAAGEGRKGHPYRQFEQAGGWTEEGTFQLGVDDFMWMLLLSRWMLLLGRYRAAHMRYAGGALLPTPAPLPRP